MRTLNWAHHIPGTSLMRWTAGLALVCLASQPAGAMVVNGTFDTGLSGWTTDGDVTAGPEAALGDNATIYSLLYQGVALTPGQYRLEFDLRNLLSADVSADPFAFPDTFFASLFFIDDLGTFDPGAAVFDDVTPLLDLDYTGAYNVTGALGASVLGPDWSHYTLDFTNTHAYAIPTFELLDFNFVSGDGSVLLDNVSITQPTGVVPEPATLTLFAMGLAGSVVARRRKAWNI